MKNIVEERLKKRKLVIRRIVTISIGLILLIGALLLYFLTDISKITDRDIQVFISNLGVWAPIVFTLIAFAQVTFIPLPGNVVIIAGALVFPPVLTFIYAFIGIFSGSLFAFFLGRKIGRPLVNWLAGDAATVDKYLHRLKGRERVLLFFMFIFPMFPDDLLCAIAGITPLKFREFVIMQLISRIPSIALTILVFSGKFIPYHGVGLIVIICLSVLMVIALILAMVYIDKINKIIDNLSSKLTKKKKN